MQKLNITKLINIIILLLVAIFIAACSNLKSFEPKNAEEAFNEGMRLFNNKDYLEAQTFFDMIKLQYPASNYADDAQYYLAEIYFKRKEYILASFNYNRLKSMYPGSEYAKISHYKSGYSQYLLSPSAEKDQDYTKRAIKTFQEFQFYYPEKDSLYENASKFIQELRNKLGEKEFKIAELYKILESPHSALIYYDSVINDYEDTSFFEPSIFGKIEALLIMGRKEEANIAIGTYNRLFPNGQYKSRIEKLLATQEKKEQE